jgi:phosphohistidine phosphatase SixA
MLKGFACALLLLSAVSSPVTAGRAGAPTVVIVVRHAEKANAPGDDNPPLSPEGVERAKSLAEIAGQAGVEVVFTTHLRRTKQTAQPFLEGRSGTRTREFRLNPAEVDAHLKEMADEIRQKHKGKTVLVVGHNTTAPRLVNELVPGANFSALDEKTEFDAVFVVIIPDSGSARAVKARYGKATGPGR